MTGIVHESKRTNWIEAQAAFTGKFGNGERACIQVYDRESVLSPKKGGWDSEIFARKLDPPHETMVTFCVNLGDEGFCDEFFDETRLISCYTIYSNGVYDKGVKIGFDVAVFDTEGDILLLKSLYQLRRFN